VISLRALYHAAMVVLLLSLCVQGLFNTVFRETPLEAWKQASILGAFGLVVLSGDAWRNTAAFLLALSCSAILVFASLFSGISFAQAGFSIFTYASWVPFLLWGMADDVPEVLHRARPILLAVLVGSAVGLFVQLLTPWLDVLIEDRQDLLFRLSTLQARRIYFLFVSSTIVMPTLTVIFTLFLISGGLGLWALTAFAALACAALATGSLSGFIVLGFALAVFLVRARGWWRPAILVLVAVGILALFASGDDIVMRQIGRVLGNDAESASNLQRLGLWAEAAALIGQFDLGQLVTGLGLGATNLGRFSSDPIIHGESSLFQAAIEGGVLGLLLRLLPFILIFGGTRDRFWRERVLCGLGVFVACAVAPIFPAIGLQAGLGLLAGLRLKGNPQSQAFLPLRFQAV
jgi:hypothetical protein